MPNHPQFPSEAEKEEDRLFFESERGRKLLFGEVHDRLIFNSDEIPALLSELPTVESFCEMAAAGKSLLDQWPGGREAFSRMAHRRSRYPTLQQVQEGDPAFEDNSGSFITLIDIAWTRQRGTADPLYNAYFGDPKLNEWFERTFQLPRTPENENRVRREMASRIVEDKWGFRNLAPRDRQLLAGAIFAADILSFGGRSSTPEECLDYLKSEARRKMKEDEENARRLEEYEREKQAQAQAERERSVTKCVEYDGDPNVRRPQDDMLDPPWLAETSLVPGTCCEVGEMPSAQDAAPVRTGGARKPPSR